MGNKLNIYVTFIKHFFQLLKNNLINQFCIYYVFGINYYYENFDIF